MTRVAVAVEGWNAEAAISFALAARRFASAVTLSAGAETVDGKDDIEVMTLGPEPGEEVLMAVEGKDEKAAFKTLVARLLCVVEPPKHRTGTALEPHPEARREARTTPDDRGLVVSFGMWGPAVALLEDEEEAAPMRSDKKGMRTGRFGRTRPRRGRKRVDHSTRDPYPPAPGKSSARRGKKQVTRKPARKAMQKPTTTRRRPRKRKKHAQRTKTGKPSHKGKPRKRKK